MVLRHYALLIAFLTSYCQADIAFNMPMLDVPLSFNKISFPIEGSMCIAANELSFYAFLILAQKNDSLKSFSTKLAEVAGIWTTTQVIGLISILMHELGHAITSKKSTFYTLKNVEIHYDFVSLLAGAYSGKTYSTYSLASAKLPRFHIENIIHFFAGPIAGMTSIYFMYTYLVPQFIKKALTEYKANETPLVFYFLLGLLAPHIASSLPSTGLHFSSDPTDFDQAYDSFKFLWQTT